LRPSAYSTGAENDSRMALLGWHDVTGLVNVNTDFSK
jgi:hypothetical protein